MKDKICIITGATSGMGLATAISLAGKGATLGLVCRDKSKGEIVVKSILEKTRNNNISLFIADLSSQAEVRRLAAEIIARYPKIDVLVNNAGAINPKRVTTVDGLELTFAVNHLAYFLLTNLLLDKLKAASKARIVSVASMASSYGKIHFDDLNFEKRYDSFKAYAQSKLANIIFTYELARRLQGTHITATCLHPGMVKTRFATGLNDYFGFFWKLINPFLITAEKGAETAIWLASSDEAEGISGKYFKNKKETRSIRSSYDPEIQKKLWTISEELCRINE
jgi:NAD(P)-dependent dehydrogenase (short-subunit alcohol dehydrogenase family)